MTPSTCCSATGWTTAEPVVRAVGVLRVDGGGAGVARLEQVALDAEDADAAARRRRCSRRRRRRGRAQHRIELRAAAWAGGADGELKLALDAAGFGRNDDEGGGGGEEGARSKLLDLRGGGYQGGVAGAVRRPRRRRAAAARAAAAGDERRSVGEIMDYIHGGKYQFDAQSGMYAGEAGRFAEAAAASDAAAVGGEEDGDDEPPPPWVDGWSAAGRPREPAPLGRRAGARPRRQPGHVGALGAVVFGADGFAVAPAKGRSRRAAANNVCEDVVGNVGRNAYRTRRSSRCGGRRGAGDDGGAVVATEEETLGEWELVVE